MDIIGLAKTRPHGIITIPKSVRDTLNLDIDDKLIFYRNDSGDIILQKNGVKH